MSYCHSEFGCDCQERIAQLEKTATFWRLAFIEETDAYDDEALAGWDARYPIFEGDD